MDRCLTDTHKSTKPIEPSTPHQPPQTTPDKSQYITRSGRFMKPKERLDLWILNILYIFKSWCNCFQRVPHFTLPYNRAFPPINDPLKIFNNCVGRDLFLLKIQLNHRLSLTLTLQHWPNLKRVTVKWQHCREAAGGLAMPCKLTFTPTSKKLINHLKTLVKVLSVSYFYLFFFLNIPSNKCPLFRNVAPRGIYNGLYGIQCMLSCLEKSYLYRFSFLTKGDVMCYVYACSCRTVSYSVLCTQWDSFVCNCAWSQEHQ